MLHLRHVNVVTSGSRFFHCTIAETEQSMTQRLIGPQEGSLQTACTTHGEDYINNPDKASSIPDFTVCSTLEALVAHLETQAHKTMLMHRNKLPQLDVQ